ncbi:MAG: CoA transferase subunit A [Actinobacteria bacterium]|nr:CoA transferase subunit A [Actinomycetota bacterium]MBU1610073.1 CoA transferase subunit A [Actinomycetota bacterium]MBU2315559.1 CoA transferase subunit A [Actinomycetota bacterium]MBU2385359.1 CoA transferase subunit A [Actinomycetota bacterium]
MGSSKVRSSAAEALEPVVTDGQTIAVGGFGLSGNPTDLIEALRDLGVKDLTIVSNNMGVDGVALGLLIENRQVRRVISSYVGENRLFAEQYLSGELEVEFAPQGTLAERMRAGGAGIGGFYTRTGVGTPVAEGKPTRELDGVEYVLERGIVADVALVRGHRADREGNLVYRKTARNFNPLAAMCGRVTFAEAEIIEEDYLDPDEIHTPGVFVQHVVPASDREKPIEKRTTRPRTASAETDGGR